MGKILSKELLIFLAAIWLVFILDLLIPFMSFNSFGIQPRTYSGVLGIVFAPFLHGGLFHIISNSISLIGAGILVRMAVGSQNLSLVMLLSALGAGIGTWIFSTAGVVVGASGVVYGLIGFLFANALYNPSIRSWGIALISLVIFGGAVLGLFTYKPFISWAGHFWGFVSGVVIARLFTNITRTPEIGE